MSSKGLHPIGGLSGLAARLGFDYGVWKVRKRSIRGILVQEGPSIRGRDTQEPLEEIEAEARLMPNMRKLEPLSRYVADYIARKMRRIRGHRMRASGEKYSTTTPRRAYVPQPRKKTP